MSPPPAYVVSTRPTVRLSDQEFEQIIKVEQENNQNSSPPDEKTLVRIHFQIYQKIFMNTKINMSNCYITFFVFFINVHIFHVNFIL